MNVNFPLEFDGRGRTADPRDDYVRQLIEQVLFTSPGERLNMPDFGSGLLQLPFAPNSQELEAATQFAVQGALQKWLNDYIVVQSVVASTSEAQLSVKVTYSLVNEDVTQVQTFVSGGEPMIYACCDERRRAAVLGNPSLNGLDYLEVLDHDAPAGSPRQQSLLLHCLKQVPASLEPANVVIAGGESITNVHAVWVARANSLPSQANAAEVAYFGSLPDTANVLVVRTDRYGDFSPYTLRLVNDAEAAADQFEVTETLSGFDPQLSEVTFNFKVECGPEFDCAPLPPLCPLDLPSPPPINYLAKDYGSFKTVLLDRLHQLLPQWQGSSEADIGVVLAELIAAVGDNLSYQQDAVATEAYLLTARSRISLRRHARLVDYGVHDGCNARTWIRLTVSEQQFVLDRTTTTTRFYTYAPDMPKSLAGNEETALLAGVVFFEPMQGATLYSEHNEFSFYTWGDGNCCLPRGATEATLLGSHPNLRLGDVLIFQEVLGPETGFAADADIGHRCAVRLTSVATKNSRGEWLVDPLFDDTGAPIVSAAQAPTPVTEIAWSQEDALPFPLCLSSKYLDADGKEHSLNDVSVAYGNVVLADHGLTMATWKLDGVPEPSLVHPQAGDRCDPVPQEPFPVRFRPQLPDRPLTQAVPLPLTGSPATANPVSLKASGAVALSDANGFTSLLVSADSPWAWPQYFGVTATPNAGNPANFDLAVVFAPGGAVAPVALEEFTNLTLAPATPMNAVAELNGRSRFVSVPATFVPPAANPTAFPAGPTMLPNTGTVDLQDTANTTYLRVQAKSPLGWPANFAVLAQGDIATTDQFNLLLLYQPPSGGVDVATPVVVEEFDGLTLQSVAGGAFASPLISVRGFEDEPNASLSAHALTNYDSDEVIPSIFLTIQGVDGKWLPEPDLLADGPDDTHFVVEVESDGTAFLRFGDNVNGERPKSGTVFFGQYRIGNGAAGNVGADSLTHFEGDPRIETCTNPLAAAGGTEPETAQQIRRRAPQAFLTQERAVTMSDYATRTEMNPDVEDAAARLRWTGSWYTAAITAEPRTGGDLTPVLEKTLIRYLNRFRLAGQDLMLESPDYVPLELELSVCVDPAYFRSDVERSLQQALGGYQPDGRHGFFAPGVFKLGQTVYLSPIYRVVRAVAGVQTVKATVFQPQGPSTRLYLDKGEIPLGPVQVARLDNDPSFPGHGRLTLVLDGGK